MNECSFSIEKIDKLRQAKGFSDTSMCKSAGVNRKTYKRMLNGENVSFVVLFKLARALGVNIADILSE